MHAVQFYLHSWLKKVHVDEHPLNEQNSYSRIKMIVACVC